MSKVCKERGDYKKIMEKEDPMFIKSITHKTSSDSDPLIVTSNALLQNRNEVVIEHRGEQYRLRRTRQDKLILTK